MEKRDLYDFKRNLTGETIFKGEQIPFNRRIVVVLVFIKNDKDQFLIQKRSIEKDGTYGFTGGHPKSGETSIQGMITEIKEELGLDVKPEELNLFYTDVDNHVFFDLYYLNKDFDISSLILQKEEVDFAKWMTINEINVLIKNGIFKKEHYEAFQRFLKYFNGGEF